MSRGNAMVMICAILMALVYIGCGSDSKDTIYICEIFTEHWAVEEGPIEEDLIGSYTLSGFDAEYYTVFGNYIKTNTEDDYIFAEGSMSVDSIYVNQSLSIAGSAHLTNSWYISFFSAEYEYLYGGVTWSDSDSGAISLDGYDIPFVVEGDVLSIEWPMYCFLLEETEPAVADSGDQEPAISSMLSYTEMDNVQTPPNKHFYPVLRK